MVNEKDCSYFELTQSIDEASGFELEHSRNRQFIDVSLLVRSMS